MSDSPEYDTICRCAACGREEHLLLASALRQGWPVCHGQEMPIIQTWADISQAFNQAVNPVTHRAAQALRIRLRRKP